MTAAPKAQACPRCQKPFICRAGNIALCDCAQIDFVITEEVRLRLEKDYDGCLCVACLKDLTAPST